MTNLNPSGSRPVTPVPPADQYASTTATAPTTSTRVQPVQTPVPPRHGSERRKHKTPLGWLPWALLGLLAALLLLSLLVGALVGKDDKSSSSTSNGSGSTSTSAGSGTGQLTAGSTDLLASRANLDKIGSLTGQQATGRGVEVQSVVADEGFWVGSSAAERVFVYLTPDARKSNGESGFQVKAGQKVDLSGTVARITGSGARELGVTDTEGARQLTGQGAYVRAATVRLSS